MLKKAALGVVALLAIFFLGRALVHALASDETKIRWLVEDALEGFGEARSAPCLRPLADDWRDETRGLAREDVHRALVATFFQDRDPRTKAFTRRVRLVPPGLEIAVDEQAGTAAFSGELLFEQKVRDEWAPDWQVRVEARLERREEGWRVVSSTHATVSGRAPR